MGFFSDKGKAAEARLAEEALYAIALREIESGKRRDGIWARALSECAMDQARAAALYIELRVQALKDEGTVLQQQVAFKQEQEIRLRQHQEKLEAERDLPRHPRCGGIIDRQQEGQVVRWKCRHCRQSGKFSVGVSYSSGGGNR